MVVHFSSACFALNEDSVAIALQCCIGCLPSGLNVHHLDGRRYRFSVASNRVGHYIYGLKDRVWPDFVCHFNLFRPGVLGPPENNSSWHSDKQIPEIVARSPIAIRSNLRFLEKRSGTDNTSQAELSKFGFSVHPCLPEDIPESSSAASLRASSMDSQDNFGKKPILHYQQLL